ncbi:winged helix-turn-helix domain-containing protein [Haloarcula salina]|uniref:winged helix-turn-helix domain-containing protein n=1 Tax=Haloarcula salina TaxID=1429914 RepID=UPI003C6EB6F5
MSTDTSTAAELSQNPTLEQIHIQLDGVIREAFEYPQTALIEALPASGKSYGVLKWAAETGNQITIFAPRHELMDEYEGWCAEDDLDLSVKRLASFHRDCQSVSLDEKGNPADELTEKLLSNYRQGVKGETIHQEARRLLGEQLPCQEHGECPFIEGINIDPESYDVLLGHYLHAYQTDWTEERYVAIDEFPGDAFVQEYTGKVAPAVTAYVEEEDRLPFRDYEELLERQSEFQEEVELWKQEVWSYYDSNHVLQAKNSSAHALGPLMTLANLEKERLDNRWRHAELGNGKVAVRNTEHEWSFLLPPNLGKAESVVALDGTPVLELWELVMGTEIERFPLLNEGNRQVYLEDILGLEIIQTTENWNAYQGGDGVSPTVDIPVVEKIGKLEGRTPGVITSKRGLKQYESYGLESLASETENYGNLKGSNAFGTTRLGIILGNPHPGDDLIEKWSALAGHSAERREGTEGKATDYGFFGNCVMKALVQNEVLQAVMRFGREEQNGEKGATVYVHTSALPDWVEPEKQLVSVDSWITPKNGMRQVIDAIYDLEGWRKREWKVGKIADRVSISHSYARKHLKTLVEQGYLDSRKAGRGGGGGAWHFSNVCLEEAAKYGHVEFSE